MRDKLFFLLKYYLFWIIFALAAKIIFLLYQLPETATHAASDYFQVIPVIILLPAKLNGP